MPMQGKPDVGPVITQSVVAVINKVHDDSALESEIGALCRYMEHTFAVQDVLRQRKQWDDERQLKVSNAIAQAMRQWDEEHYPRLLEAVWGWHPFYPSFICNPLCAKSRPAYPLYNSVVEGLHVHAQLLQQSDVRRVYPVPWSVLFLRCFLKYHTSLPPLISHPHSGGSVDNVLGWLKLAEDIDGGGSRAWHLAITHLKEEGFLIFAGARSVESQHEWVAGVEAAFLELKNPTPGWWTELRDWCNSIQVRAHQDMAFHDKTTWLNAWVIRDRPTTSSPPLACYDRWLQHREDLDIGYVLARPGNLTHFTFIVTCTNCRIHSRCLQRDHVRVCIPSQMSWSPRWSVVSICMSFETLPTILSESGCSMQRCIQQHIHIQQQMLHLAIQRRHVLKVPQRHVLNVQVT